MTQLITNKSERIAKIDMKSLVEFFMNLAMRSPIETKAATIEKGTGNPSSPLYSQVISLIFSK